MFRDFTAVDGIPIYSQIISHLKRGMVAGTVRHGDELPSRRVLSALLGVNPNTVQKAYRLLEEEGLIQSHSGAKSYVVLTADVLKRVRDELLESEISAMIRSMQQMGLSEQEAVFLLKKHWK
jgi:GntR family transcriptional regulator